MGLVRGSFTEWPPCPLPKARSRRQNNRAVVTESLLTVSAVFVYLGTLDFFFFFFLTRNLNHILFAIFQKDVAMWLPFYKLLNKTVSGSQLCLKNNGFGAQASLLRTPRTVTKAKKNPVQSWLTATCSGKSQDPSVSTEGLFPFCWDGSDFGPAALLICTSALRLLTLLEWKRSSGKAGMKTITSGILPSARD